MEKLKGLGRLKDRVLRSLALFRLFGTKPPLKKKGKYTKPMTVRCTLTDEEKLAYIQECYRSWYESEHYDRLVDAEMLIEDGLKRHKSKSRSEIIEDLYQWVDLEPLE